MSQSTPVSNMNATQSKRVSRDSQPPHNLAEEIHFVEKHDMPNSGRFYFVSALWLKRWGLFVRSSGEHPGHISNYDLLHANSVVPTVRADVKRGRDYRGVSKEVWEYLLDLYGGGPEISNSNMDIHSRHTMINTDPRGVRRESKHSFRDKQTSDAGVSSWSTRASDRSTLGCDSDALQCTSSRSLSGSRRSISWKRASSSRGTSAMSAASTTNSKSAGVGVMQRLTSMRRMFSRSKKPKSNDSCDAGVHSTGMTSMSAEEYARSVSVRKWTGEANNAPEHTEAPEWPSHFQILAHMNRRDIIVREHGEGAEVLTNNVARKEMEVPADSVARMLEAMGLEKSEFSPKVEGRKVII
mmetsp:Transcript_61213/g.145746  ORF Transcript_61213/g.145746 Transcript_61213/m.145746 type:complete len:354 (-) Transcript_61213:246-1307(-)